MDHDSRLTFLDLRQRRVSKAERQSPILAVQDFLLCNHLSSSKVVLWEREDMRRDHGP